ncbi:hypothetical protein PVT67_10885 [Gallaecimonas kandeliae]|uniref:hypothetical protein n=1 Tax=Gallaecimonas kandeliae TaxID=3029055 RepID=UPI0026472B00|nr:hypothetical protein [Gallaecimonas kandeliae]WKE64198.1 hypothetical protein PVT67_10885 [Gallaecimonas kandeliae]
MKWLWRLFFLTLTSGLLASSLLFFALYRTYDRLGMEVPVARLRFEKLDDQLYQLHLRTPGLCQERSFPVRGDDWRLDARFIKWPNWLTVLGLQPQYRLERVEGRFRDIEQANATPHQAYALSPQTWVKPAWLDSLHFLVDSDYGSSAYAPMDSDKDYVVYHSASGLFARAVPQATGQGPLELTADSPCLVPESYWSQAATWLDTRLRALQGGA